MKMHMKNPLWVTNPHEAKREFEHELREILKELKVIPIREVLGE